MKQIRGVHRELQMLRRIMAPSQNVLEKMMSPIDQRWIDMDDDEPIIPRASLTVRRNFKKNSKNSKNIPKNKKKF